MTLFQEKVLDGLKEIARLKIKLNVNVRDNDDEKFIRITLWDKYHPEEKKLILKVTVYEDYGIVEFKEIEHKFQLSDELITFVNNSF